MNALAVRADPLDAVLRAVDRKYRYPARRFVGYLRAEALPLGDPQGWRKYLDSLGDLSASTYNAYLSALKACVRQALRGAALTMTAPELRVIEDEVAALKGKSKPAPGSYIPDKVCTPEEVVRLIDAANAPRWGVARNAPRPDIALAIEFLWETGLRISEALSIKLKDMKPMGDVVRIRIMGKGGKERFAKPNRDLVDRIRAHFGGIVYLFEHGGHPYNRSHVSIGIHRIGLAVLGRSISAHALRHSIGTFMYKRTHNLVGVQHFLGHTSSTTTAAYYVHDSFDDAEIRGLTALPRAAVAS